MAKVLGPGGALEALVEAREQGLVRHIGVSSHALGTAVDLVKTGQFETLQYPFNFVAHEAQSELLPLCREMGVGFIAMKPLGGGLIPHARLAIKYLGQFADVVADPGIESLAEMRELIAAAEEPSGLTEADLGEIEAIRKELGTRFCHRCDYCQPCDQGIAISMVLAIRSFMRRFPPERAYNDSTVATVARAQTCVECGDCESRCPYQLPIREMLKVESAGYFAAKVAAGR
jgi:predicted aldo/keto reductase-like oxidoreductase